MPQEYPEPLVYVDQPTEAIVSTTSGNAVNSSAITFTRVVGLSRLQFYAVHQTASDLNLYIYLCTSDSTSPNQVTCDDANGVTITMSGVVQSFQQANLLGQLPMWAVVTDAFPNQILGYDFSGNLIFNQTRRARRWQNQVNYTDLKIGSDMLLQMYERYDGSKYINVSFFEPGLPLCGVISNVTTMHWPLLEPFIPVNIIAHPKSNGVVFVQLQQGSVVIMQVQGCRNYKFINNFTPNYTGEFYNVSKIFLSDEVMVIAFDNGGAAKGFGAIQEYCIRDLTNIYQLNNYTLHGWSVYANLTAEFSASTNLLYVLMQHPKSKALALFVYRVGFPLIQGVYKIFTPLTFGIVGEIVTSLNISAGGYSLQSAFGFEEEIDFDRENVDFVYVSFFDSSSNLIMRLYRVPAAPYVVVAPQYIVADYYTNQFSLNITIVPWDSQFYARR